MPEISRGVIFSNVNMLNIPFQIYRYIIFDEYCSVGKAALTCTHNRCFEKKC